MENKIIYSTDYRSPPTGCGVIEFPDGKKLLIQYPDCRPDVKEGYYDEIIQMHNCFSETYINAQLELSGILARYKVTHVYDYELYSDLNQKESTGLTPGYMTVHTFRRLRSSI
jgi:hypothetical protein